MRYEQCWLPLLAEHTVWGNAKFQLVVPLDCEWIWHCHRLNPVQYGKDCKKIYGRIMDASFVESSIKGADRKQTQEIWKYSYPEEPYELDLSHSVSGNSARMIFKSILKIEYDLTEAVRRQSSFFHQVSRPCMFDDRFLKGAEERYKGFLYLIKKNRDNSVNCFSVPTYDIDLMWHSHQLQPVAYTRDMLNLLGKVLAHDDTESDRSKGKKLDLGFTETKRQWEDTYGRRYWRAGAMYRGDAPSSAPVAPLALESSDGEDSDCAHGPLLQSSEDSNCVQETLFQSNKDRYQTPVKIVEVLLEVVGIRNIPNDQKGNLSVRFYRYNCPRMEAKKVEITSESQSKPIASFRCTATGNFIFELRSRSSRNVEKTSKVLGQVSIPMQTLLDSTTLSVEDWFPLSTNGQPAGSNPISMHIAVSTTPTTATYMFWSVRSHSSERKFQFLELNRRIKGATTVTGFFDHDDKEVFTVKTRTTAKPYTGSLLRSEGVTVRNSPEKRRIVTVHERNPNKSRSSGEPVATAEELITVGGTAQWVLMNYSCNLLIRNIDNFIKEEPIFDLRGNLGTPLRLLSGKKLQYEVQCANREIEHEFVTLIRYTPEVPFGQATALFNWKSGIVEVTAEESVLLVVFLSEVISASLRKHHKRLKYTSSLEAEAKKVFPTGSDARHGMRINGSDQKIKVGGNGCRGGYGNSRWVGHAGGSGFSGTKASRAELALLSMGIDDERYGRAGCDGGCGG